MMSTKVLTSLVVLCCLSAVWAMPGDLVLMKDGISMGAVCLDGTPPGYYFRPGSGSGRSKLIMHMEGGGWCYNEDDCVGRSKTNLGSSKNWGPTASFNGFLSDDPQLNPLFYNWTLVFLKYCDGASFAGNVDKVVNWKDTDLHFRGFRILDLAVESVKSIANFSEVILTGCSAGGLATYIHTDYVASKFPGATFHAIADAGYFIDANNVNGEPLIRKEYQYVFKMQNCAGGVNQDCVKDLSPKGEEWKCFFPQYTEPYIKNKLFGLNSQYDTWQLGNILQLPCNPPKCTPDQMKLLENFGKEFLEAAADFIAGDSRGFFFDSCLHHCQSLGGEWTNIMVNGQRANETFATWYYEGSGSGSGREVDCAYPCNHSC
ncbi:uncharacterized protein LOC135341593 [Halichondria panicea]|uniref:uncharacterized protein LOC135341593 n=1 Tax=Halichondria panicea TaxID=6063 RepID=UPI00312B62C3